MKVFSSKQPYEELTYRFGFTEDLDLIDEDIGSLASVAVVDMDDEDTDLASTMYDADQSSFSGRYVYVRIKGGTSGQRYKITVKIVSVTTGQKCELEALLPVREI